MNIFLDDFFLIVHGLYDWHLEQGFWLWEDALLNRQMVKGNGNKVWLNGHMAKAEGQMFSKNG